MSNEELELLLRNLVAFVVATVFVVLPLLWFTRKRQEPEIMRFLRGLLATPCEVIQDTCTGATTLSFTVVSSRYQVKLFVNYCPPSGEWTFSVWSTALSGYLYCTDRYLPAIRLLHETLRLEEKAIEAINEHQSKMDKIERCKQNLIQKVIAGK